MPLKFIMLALGVSLLSTDAIAQSGEPLSVANLQWARIGEVVVIPVDQAPPDIKVGDKFFLVDASNKEITGTGTVSVASTQGSATGPITSWNIRVDTLEN